jgi:transcriptional regulator with XRE-family HTH domain
MSNQKRNAAVISELKTRAYPRREPGPMQRIRVARNLTQTDLAVQLGMSTSAVSLMECYPSRLPLRVATQVAKLLGVKVVDLYPKGFTP